MDELRIDELIADVHIGQELSIAVPLLHIKNQCHPFPLDEVTIHRLGDVLVRLPAPRRMNDFRPANADVPDGLDPVPDGHVEAIASRDTTDVPKKPLGLGS
jgi:hypothetical protein